MIRTNLSTRPFYNERAVRFWLLAIAVAVVAATAFNVSRVIRYSRSDTQLATQASRDEARAADLRQQARGRASVDPRQIEFVRPRAPGQRLDRSSTDVFDAANQFETMPDEVRTAGQRSRPRHHPPDQRGRQKRRR